jgi:hypothetical protein
MCVACGAVKVAAAGAAREAGSSKQAAALLSEVKEEFLLWSIIII